MGSDGQPVYLRDIWPSSSEIQEFIDHTVTSELFKTRYADVFTGDERWRGVAVAGGLTYDWDAIPPTCRTRPISRTWTGSEAHRRASRTRASWACSATRSPPTTSRPRATSAPRLRPASI